MEISETLLRDFSSFLDFGKIVLILCGLQKQVFSSQEMAHIYKKFIEQAPSIIKHYDHRERMNSERVLNDLTELGREKFDLNMYLARPILRKIYGCLYEYT